MTEIGMRSELSARTQAGSLDFEEFATVRTTHLFRTAYYLCGDWHLAEDLTQTALANLYRSWGRVRVADNPVAYAQTTLIKAFLSYRRKPSNTERPIERVPDSVFPDGAADLRLVLTKALLQLSPKDRAVVVLRYWEDLSVEQTADVLGYTASAVRSRASRALVRLRETLGSDFAALVG